MNPGYRILILAPSSRPDDALAADLAQAGHLLHWCDTLGRATARLNDTEIDVIVVALGADAAGPDAVGRLARQANGRPLLIMTARDAAELRLQGLRRGAVDYLIHPCSAGELLIRVDTAVARSRPARERYVKHGGILLDRNENRFGDGTHWTILTPNEYRAFQVFLDRKDSLVSKECLKRHLPDNETVSDNAIEVLIHRLRSKVGPYGMRIQAHRGTGYMLEAAVPAHQP